MNAPADAGRCDAAIVRRKFQSPCRHAGAVSGGRFPV